MNLRPLPRPVLMLVTEPQPRLADIVGQAVSGGVNVVQVRDIAAELERLCDCIIQVREALHGRGVLLANRYPQLGRKVDGVHLPEGSMSVREARRFLDDRCLVGRSVHSVSSASQAEAEGADYLVAGMIFKSSSHPGIAHQGLGFLRDVCELTRIPVIAIGGITSANAGECMRAGAAGVAVISGILRAADPQAAAQAYWKSLTTEHAEVHGDS